jgi:2,3-bisphosphoglycerate-dependent phosphoglycerate mutase
MIYLLLHRHGQSKWNITDAEQGLTARFTGWVDIELTDKGIQQARASGQCLKMFGIRPDAIYTSILKRATKTLDEMGMIPLLTKLGRDVDIINSWRLNERHYGVLTGYPKANIGKLFGEEAVTQWRRSWDIAPPPLHREDHMDLTTAKNAQPKTYMRSNQRNIVAIEKNIQAPDTESLKDCASRVLPLWNYSIAPRVLRGETVLVVAHANSIRSLLKCIEGSSITETTLRSINIPSAIPLIYDFAAMIGDDDVLVDEIPNQSQINPDDILGFNKTSYTSKLLPLGVPSKLGVRGRYIANKELINLDLGISTKTGTSDIVDLIGKSLDDIIKFSDEGDGKSDALVITDGKGVIVHSNQAWSSLCGYSREDVLGKTNSILQGPLTNHEDINRLNEKLITGLPVKGSIINYRKNGNPFVNKYEIFPVHEPSKMISNLGNINNDLGPNNPNILSKSELNNSDLGPNYFIAKLEVTPDRLDLLPIVPKEVKLREHAEKVLNDKENEIKIKEESLANLSRHFKRKEGYNSSNINSRVRRVSTNEEMRSSSNF